jgi:uncharacterized membrane protein YsdA (DUF1294 family)
MVNAIAAITLWMISCSLVLIALYKIDKSKAVNGWSRIPERSLLTTAAIGGWPGALLAQKWFRHKTRKQSYRRLLWLCIAANIAVVVVLLGAWHTFA